MGTKLRFINNIIALSENDIFSIARHEWREDIKIEGEDGEKTFKCICTHWLKNATFMKNIKTGKCIMVGDACKRRLLLYPGETLHKYEKTTYNHTPLDNIDDLEEYSKTVEDFLSGTVRIGLKHHKAIRFYEKMVKNILSKILDIHISKVVLDSTDEDNRKKLISHYKSQLFTDNNNLNFKIGIKELEIYLRQLALLINNGFYCLESLLDNCAFIFNKKKEFMEIRKLASNCDFIED